MKKWLLGLETVLISAVPALLIMSCSSNGDEEKNNFKITKKESKDININVLDLNVEPLSLITLNKIFDGITEDIYKNITSSINIGKNLDEKIVMLKANEGFKINGEETFSSSSFIPSQDFEITIKPVSSIIIYENELPLDEKLSHETLNKIFNGITTSIHNNITTIVRTTSLNESIVEIIANAPYTINGTKSLITPPFIPLTIQADYQILAKPTAEILDVSQSELRSVKLSIETLNKIFDNFPIEAYSNITTTVNYDAITKQPVVTLNTNLGYLINGQRSFSSSLFNMTLVAIGKIEMPKVNFDEIKGVINFNTLQKVFSGLIGTSISSNNIANVVFNPTTRIITLTSSNGYVFNNGTDTLASNPITINLVITKKELTPKDIFYDSDFPTSTSNKISNKTLNRFFVGIDLNVHEVINTSYSKNASTNASTVTISVNEGYLINDIFKTLTTDEFIMIDLLKKPTILDIDQNNYNITAETFFESNKDKMVIELIEILFKKPNPTKLNADNVLNIELQVINNITGQLNITFTLDHEKFNFEPGVSVYTMSLNGFQKILSEITPLTNPTLNLDDVRSGNISLNTAKQVFSGLENIQWENIASAIYDPNNRIITLVTKSGYIFHNGTNTLVSNPININFVISTKIQSGGIIEADLTGPTINLEILKKLFNGFELVSNEELQNIDIQYISDHQVIVLTPKSGYTIAGSENSLESNPIKITLQEITKVESKIFFTPDNFNDPNITNIEILKKVFNGLKDSDLAINKLLSAIYDPNSSTITLTAQDGYLFNNGLNTLQSNQIDIILSINNLSTPILNLANIKESIISMESLRAVFINLDQDTLLANKLQSATYNAKDRTITLISASRYAFDNETNTLVSNPITINLAVEQKSLLTKQITKNELINVAISLETINKLFTGFELANEDDLSYFNVEHSFTVDGNNKSIVHINPKNGYTFNDKSGILGNVSSIRFDITIANVEPNGSKIINIEDLQKEITFDVVKQLFWPQMEGEFVDYNLQGATYDSNTRKISLISNPGYIFKNGTTTLLSDSIITNFTLGLIEQVEIITEAELTGTISLETVKKLFTGFDNITELEFSNLAATYNSINKTITLSSIPNISSINGQPSTSLVSNTINITSTKNSEAKNVFQTEPPTNSRRSLFDWFKRPKN